MKNTNCVSAKWPKTIWRRSILNFSVRILLKKFDPTLDSKRSRAYVVVGNITRFLGSGSLSNNGF
jgi:hypothetical protein